MPKKIRHGNQRHQTIHGLVCPGQPNLSAASSIVSQTKRTYVVGGVILSKNRVEKNIEEVGALELSLSNKVYLSLASNTILSESEHDVMQKMIQGSVKNKV